MLKCLPTQGRKKPSSHRGPVFSRCSLYQVVRKMRNPTPPTKASVKAHPWLGLFDPYSVVWRWNKEVCYHFLVVVFVVLVFLLMHNLNANLVFFTLATALCSIIQHYPFCQVGRDSSFQCFPISQSLFSTHCP